MRATAGLPYAAFIKIDEYKKTPSWERPVGETHAKDGNPSQSRPGPDSKGEFVVMRSVGPGSHAFPLTFTRV